jgi:hypothetical protein
MADSTNTSQSVRRTLSHEDILQLAQFTAARAAPKLCKNQAAREQLLLIAALLGVLAHEHPQGLSLDVKVQTKAGVLQ